MSSSLEICLRFSFSIISSTFRSSFQRISSTFLAAGPDILFSYKQFRRSIKSLEEISESSTKQLFLFKIAEKSPNIHLTAVLTSFTEMATFSKKLLIPFELFKISDS